MTLPIIVLIALIAGLAAAGAAWFLLTRPAVRTKRPSDQRFAIEGGAFVVAALVVGGLLYAITGDGNGGQVAVRLLDAIQRHHPEAKAEIEAIARETSPVRAQQRSAELAQRYLPRHIPTTSDAAVLRFTGEMAKVFENLAQKDPETCKALSGAGNASVSASFDPQNMQAALDAMAQVIDDSVNASQPPPQAQRAQELMAGVVARVYAQPNTNLASAQMLAQPALVPATQLCNTMSAFYREILKLPPADASTVLRTLMRSPAPR